MPQIPKSALSTYRPPNCTECGGTVQLVKYLDVDVQGEEPPMVIPSQGRCNNCGAEPFLD